MSCVTEGVAIIRIGVDVGGTNTDAVLMDGREVKAAHKARTHARVSEGILAAISHVLAHSGVAAADVQAVMVGTTHFTNAFVERRRLQPVGVLRLALPATRGVPPMVIGPQAFGLEEEFIPIETLMKTRIKEDG